jgi:hypothetical protein
MVYLILGKETLALFQLGPDGQQRAVDLVAVDGGVLPIR